MLTLTLAAAVKVTQRLVEDGISDKEIIRQELEQKCWIVPKSNDAAKRLSDLIFDINPAEICAQIEADNLKKWCEIIQTEMKMAMVQLPCWGKDGEADEGD
jgi:hypothetical protein